MSLFILDNSISCAVLPRGLTRATPHESSVTTGGNQSTKKNLWCFVDSYWTTLFFHITKCNLKQTTARSRNWTRMAVLGDACTTTVSPAPLCSKVTFTWFWSGWSTWPWQPQAVLLGLLWQHEPPVSSSPFCRYDTKSLTHALKSSSLPMQSNCV